MPVLLFLTFLILSQEYNNGVGKLPVMGWSSWNQYGCDINEELILNTMESIVKSGLKDLGYIYVNLDDCWQKKERSKEGKQIVDPNFPNGMEYLVEKAHQYGLKIGLYTDIGIKTCAGRSGSYGHYEIDAKQYSEWKIDFLKVDFCYLLPDVVKEPWKFYTNFSNAMNNTGRAMVFNICNWGAASPWEWAPKISHQWRTTMDIDSSWYKVAWNLQKTAELSEYASLYSYNDPDMLEVGVLVGKKSLNLLENKAHFAAWCMLSAPLVLGLDVSNIEDDVFEIISNKELISINQDEKGKQGFIILEIKKKFIGDECFVTTLNNCTFIQVFKKELSNNDFALMILNRASDYDSYNENFNSYEEVTVNWEELNLDPKNQYKIRDLYEHKDLGNYEREFKTRKIEQHDVQILRFSLI